MQMILSVVQFFVHWLLSSQYSTRDYSNLNTREFYDNTLSSPPKSHWTLLSEFHTISQHELEAFIPQLCNLALDRESLNDDRLFEYFETILVNKCADSFSFGVRVCSLLKASINPPSEGLFRNLLAGSNLNSAIQQKKEDRMRNFYEKAEYATSRGFELTHEEVQERSNYFQDLKFLMETLGNIGMELKRSPLNRRSQHLRQAINQCNVMLFRRMMSKYTSQQPPHAATDDPSAYRNHNPYSGNNQDDLSSSSNDFHIQDIFHNEVTSTQIAQLCPEVADFSIHLPLQYCHENTLRILQFVENECDILPSKERCPFLVVVEVLEQSYFVGSDLLYLQGNKRFASQSRNSDRLLESPKSNVVKPNGVLEKIRHELNYEEYDPFSVDDFNQDKSTTTTEDVNLNQPYESTPQAHTQNLNGPTEEVLSSNVKEFARSDMDPREARKVLIQQVNQWDYESDRLLQNNRVAPQQPQDQPIQLLEENKITPPSANKNFNRRNRHRRYQDNYRGGENISDEDNEFERSYPMGTNIGNDNNRNEMIYQNRQNYYPPIRMSKQSNEFVDHQNMESSPRGMLNNANEYNRRHPSTMDQSNAQFDNNYMMNDYRPNHSEYFQSSPPTLSIREYPNPISPMEQPFQPPPTRGIVRGKTWAEKKSIIRQLSPFGQLPGWDLKSFIVKSGDDLRKETLAMQMIEYMNKIFHQDGVLDIFLRPYQIVSTGYQTGLVEFVEGSLSVDKIKKSLQNGLTIKDYFELQFGASFTVTHSKAVRHFVSSLAGYSLVTYVLQVKDRHNANILIDSDGHMIHIDYGFILGDSPGFNINFESAPFKLTKEYVDLMGGIDSTYFRMFEELFLRGFSALQRHSEELGAIVQLFYGDKRKNASDGLRSRLLFPQSQSDVIGLIRESLDNWRTKQYDWFQQRTNNIQA